MGQFDSCPNEHQHQCLLQFPAKCNHNLYLRISRKVMFQAPHVMSSILYPAPIQLPYNLYTCSFMQLSDSCRHTGQQLFKNMVFCCYGPSASSFDMSYISEHHEQHAATMSICQLLFRFQFLTARCNNNCTVLTGVLSMMLHNCASKNVQA